MEFSEIQTPEFEIILDNDTNELVDVSYLGESLVDVLPCIHGVHVKATCSLMNTVLLECVGTANITYLKNED